MGTSAVSGFPFIRGPGLLLRTEGPRWGLGMLRRQVRQAHGVVGRMAARVGRLQRFLGTVVQENTVQSLLKMFAYFLTFLPS